jgi:hypothetical protein
MAVSRLRLQGPGLSLAPGQHSGKDHEHHQHGGRNQYRVDRHDKLLLITPKDSDPDEAIFDEDQIAGEAAGLFDLDAAKLMQINGGRFYRRYGYARTEKVEPCCVLHSAKRYSRCC